MAKKKRGRWVGPVAVRVKAKGKNLELTFRVPGENVSEVFRHVERFVKKTKGGVKRTREQLAQKMN